MPTTKKQHGRKSCALFWDESFLWGIMSIRALREAGVSFDLIRSEDIRAGHLQPYAMICVPGGWASAKLHALGTDGKTRIRRFVENGGSYLGLCGGAGLATQSGIGLLAIGRKSTQERVPSFSGPIRLSLADHRIWKGIASPVFHAWWPPQLDVPAGDEVRVLGRYAKAQGNAFSADVRVGDGQVQGWNGLEEQYGVLLNPDRLKDEPAVVEGRHGRGIVMLSLVHFDTPGDPNGAVVLRNLWDYLMDGINCPVHCGDACMAAGAPVNQDPQINVVLEEIKNTVDRVIVTGEEKALWTRRNSLLLQWRRGIRGMEYSTLSAMITEIHALLSPQRTPGVSPGKKHIAPVDPKPLMDDLMLIRERVIPFAREAEKLLHQERQLPAEAFIASGNVVQKEVVSLRRDLFGEARAFGGKFKRLIDVVDHLLYRLLMHSF